MTEEEISSIVGFDWDKGNSEKNWIKHHVTKNEIEEIFFNKPALLLTDEKHSSVGEKRLKILGRTNLEKHLLIVFTVRNNQIRPISARIMSLKERHLYEKAAQTNS